MFARPLRSQVAAQRPPRRTARSPDGPAEPGASAGGEPAASRGLDRRPAIREPQRDPLGPRAVLVGAQPLDELPGVDPDRAGEHAGAVRGAGLDRVVLELLQRVPAGPAIPAPGGPSRGAGRCAGGVSWSGPDSGRRARRTRTRRNSSPPPRSRASSSGSSDGHAGSSLKITPGASTPSGSASRFTRRIRLGRLRPPLALDERRHVDAGAVLGLQRAVVLVDDELDQPFHECRRSAPGPRAWRSRG